MVNKFINNYYFLVHLYYRHHHHHQHHRLYAQVIKTKKNDQPCTTYSQMERLGKTPNSSSPRQRSPASPPHRPLPPPNYTPTGYDYNFTNFGLPHYDGNHQYFNLINGVTWIPNTPTTLILAMNNLHVLRVGLAPIEAKTINSILFEMHRAMSSHHQSIEVEYLTHNS